MKCRLCYLTPNIKLLILIKASFFIGPYSESTLLFNVTPAAPALLLRLGNLPALSFICHCSLPSKIGSRGEWEGKSLADETDWLYLNQLQILNKVTQNYFLFLPFFFFFTGAIKVKIANKRRDVNEICLTVF